jgi:hypothetical protein
MKIKEVVYGLGGYDESKPNNNIIEIIEYTKEELKVLELETKKEQAKTELLDRLGITKEEVELLLS